MYENLTGFPSTTEILSPHLNTDWFTEESAARGDGVHSGCSAYAQGLFVPPLPAEWQDYLESGKKWINMMVEKVVLVETRLISKKYGYCGKPDLVAVLRGNDFNTLIDFKTGQAVERWWSLQSASYRQLVQEDKGIIVKNGMSVRLKPDGSGGLATDCLPYQACLNVFLSELNSFKFFSKAA